jgi:hypothetical protein
VPIGWVAVGDPAKILSPDKHEEIWQLQGPMNFPFEAYGRRREAANMKAITKYMSQTLSKRKDDEKRTESDSAN